MNNTNFSLFKTIFKWGFISFMIFALVENLVCYLSMGLYWEYYVFSLAVWLMVTVTVLFILAVMGFIVKRLFPKIRENHNRNSLFLTIVVLFLPQFFYTVIQSVKRLPGKFYSFENVAVILVLFFLVVLLGYFTYRFLQQIQKSFIVYFILLASFLAISSVFGVLIVGSEIQNQHWLLATGLMVGFNILIPFLLLFLLKRQKKVSMPVSVIIVLLVLALEWGGGVAIAGEGIRPIAFSQESGKRTQIIKQGKKPSPNILLMVMDTARAANMSLYGYTRATTPFLEKFARDGVVFKNAISSSSWTLPSHASLFTGLPPYLHGSTHGNSRYSGPVPLDKQFDTLAEILSAHGYRTGAVVANTAYLAPWSGLNQGFDYYWWGRTRNQCLIPHIFLKFFSGHHDFKKRSNLFGLSEYIPAHVINRMSLGWILDQQASGFPWFCFVNYMEPHGMAFLPSPFNTLFTPPPMTYTEIRDVKSGLPLNLDAKIQNKVRAWYDNGMSCLDYEIGLLLSGLKKNDVYDNTLIIVTSDHGELLGEHNDYGHYSWLFQELIHVPLIIKYPRGVKESDYYEAFMQDIDVFAEILHQVGIELPENIPGQPLDRVGHAIFSEIKKSLFFARHWPSRYGCSIKSIFSRQYSNLKLITYGREKAELYDIFRDPGEMNPLADKTKISLVEKELMTYLAHLEKNRKIRANTPEKLDEETRKRLRTLGYIK